MKEQSSKLGKIFGCVTFSILFGIIIGIAAFIIHVYYFESVIIQKYCIVIDAGPDDSQINIYGWQQDSAGVVGNLEKLGSRRSVGGFPSNFKDLEDAYIKLKEDVDGLLRNDIDRATIPIFVGTSINMLIASYKNPQDFLRIYEHLPIAFNHDGFKKCEMISLSADEDALYRWPTFKRGSQMELDNENLKESRGKLETDQHNVAFSHYTEEWNRELNFTQTVDNQLEIGGEKYNIYSHTFICYGSRQIYLRLLAQLIDESPHSWSIANPCMIKGHKFTMEAREIAESPCTYGGYAKSFLKEYNKPEMEEIDFYGVGNYSECDARINALFVEQPCSSGNCFFDGSAKYNNTQSLMTRGVFGDMKIAFPDEQTPSRSKWIEHIRDFCEKSHSNLDPGDQSCLRGVYALVLLDKLGLDTDESWTQIVLPSDTKSKRTSWADGFMMVNVDMFASQTEVHLPYALFFVLLLLCFSLLAIACFLLLSLSCKDQTLTFGIHSTRL